MENELKTIQKQLDQLEELQNKLDKKTKDAEAYKQSNEHLVNIIKLLIGCILIICISFFITLAYTNQKYASGVYGDLAKLLENGMIETTTETTTMESGENGVIITDINNSSINN